MSRPTPTLPLRLHFACVAILATFAVHVSAPSGASAGYQVFDWRLPSSIDSGLPSEGRAQMAVQYRDGIWNVVYTRDGGICYVSGIDGDWTDPFWIAPAGSEASHPDIAIGAEGSLAVVWEAPGSGGGREIQIRSGSESSWNAPLALSTPGAWSHRPTVSGLDLFVPRVIVAWEDSTGAGWRVRSRVYSGAWGAAVTMGNGTSDARDPDVAVDELGQRFLLAWSDFRDGDADIYTRYANSTPGWQTEELFIETPFDCRHPAVVASWSGDTYFPERMVVCEAEGSEGATEVYGRRLWCHPVTGAWLSDDDGVPSRSPDAGGFNMSVEYCQNIPTTRAAMMPAWIEGAAAIRQLRIDDCSSSIQSDDLAASDALAFSAAVSPGRVCQLWTENSGGTVVLRAREGTTADCFQQRVRALTSLLIGPEGWPPTRLRAEDACSGVGFGGFDCHLLLNEDGYTLDPEQGVPEGTSDSDGLITISIRGGGCSWAETIVGSDCGTTIHEVHSPDIDADCAVTDADRNYVVSRLGTSDFCADIDGSGTVDELDVAIVDATLGDACSHVTAVEGGTAPARPAGLSAEPNPASRQTILRLLQPGDGSGADAIRIVDATGRQVRSIPVPSTAGEGTILWNLTDDRGRPLPAGMYFALGRLGDGSELRTPLVILR